MSFRKLVTFLVVLVFVLMLDAKVMQATAVQTWYVATTGNNTNDCLTAGTPCLTIAGAVTKASSGDTIIVAAGTYADALINLNKPLTLQGAEAGTDARTRGPGGITAAETQLTATGQIFELAAANITIDGFAFPNLGLRGIDNTGTDANSVTIKNNIILSTAGNCAGGGIIQFGGGHSANNFTFNQNYVVQNNSSECGSVLYMGNAMDGGTISNNYVNASGVTFGPFSGASGGPAGWVIEGNELNGNLSGHGDYWGFGFNAQFGNVVIQNNYVHKMYIGLGQISVVGGSVSGNTFDDNQYAAFQLWGGEFSTIVSSNVTIQNNLIKYNGTPTVATDHTDASHGLRLRVGLDPTTIHLQYNSFTDLGVGASGQAWAIRNSASPALADATSDWWGQNTGPAAAQTDGYETTSPYITAYTLDPSKTPPSYYGFWPLIATSTATQVSAGSIDVSGNVSDTATITATGTSGLPMINPTGNVQFSYCYSASSTPASCAGGTAIGDPITLTADLTLDGMSTATLSTWTPPNGTGYYLLHAAYTGDALYAGSADTGTNESVTVALPTPTFTFDLSTLPAKTFGDASFSVAGYVTTNSTGTVSFVLGTGSVGCSVTSVGQVTITGAAVNADYCIIAASLGASADYSAAGPISQSFHIAQATTTININNIPGGAVFGGSFTPAYTYTGDGTTYATSSTAACTVSSGLVNFVGVGTCTLTAHANAGTNYAASTGNSQSFTIARLTPTISINNIPGGAVYNRNFIPTYTYAGDGSKSATSSTPNFCTVSGSTVNFMRAGLCTLVAHATATANSAAATGSPQSFTIAKASATITINNIPVNAVYNGSFSPTFTYNGDGKSSATSSTPNTCKPTDGKVTFVGVGTCTLTASATAGTNYAAVTGSSQSFTIGQVTTTISIKNIPTNAKRGGSFTANYNYVGDGTTYVTSSTAACTVPVNSSVVTFVASGPCTLTAHANAGIHYAAATGNSQTFTIK